MCSDNNTKIFRSIIKQYSGIVNVSKFNFTLDLPSNDYKYIELIAYGIHNDGANNIRFLNIPNIFNSPLIVHDTNNFQFLNISHGLISSVNSQLLSGILSCNITPSINNISVDSDLTIALYFVIHY